jgi:O-antigen ligase
MTKINNNIQKYINYIIVVYAFVIPISRAAIVFFTALLIILAIIDNIKNTKDIFLTIKNNKVVLYISIFIMYSLLSVFWSDDIKETLIYTSKYWYFAALVIIYKYIKKEYISYAISSFLAAMFISEVVSYGLFFEFWTYKHGSVIDPTPFMNHLQYSMFLAFTSLLLLNRFFVERKYIFRLGYFLYFLTVTVNLFINGGRTGQVAFIVSIFVVGFLNIKNKLKALFLMSLLLFIILFSAYKYSPVFQTRINDMYINIKNIIYYNDFNTSSGVRIGFYIIGYDILKDNPLIGVGVSDTMNEVKKYANNLPYDFNKLKTMPNVHNDFLQILIQLGIIGALLYILIFYNIFKIIIKDIYYKNLPIIFVSIYVISSMFENMIHQQFSMLLFTLFVGLFLAQNRIENEITINK